ncbi:uncharacterized protein LOC119461094 isoform X1 [Dermacentor silvarum]|uniref:uncharacterized protein LOC119461094 isoform X1 n=1 Tax=Dermacentor silvarum TaxID=543639 RepID=UPI001897C825|nr:uncharacterized protein LOC119461094 isoform X1 [Dermacentor silvarum]XP_037578206.1 uncharacterized protein LOC119461094 isoform X1 [Dermacentor silvarum]
MTRTGRPSESNVDSARSLPNTHQSVRGCADHADPEPPRDWCVADLLLGRRLRGVVRGALTSRPPRLPPAMPPNPQLVADQDSLSRASTPARSLARSTSWETIFLYSEYARPLDVLSENWERHQRRKILRRLFCCCPQS